MSAASAGRAGAVEVVLQVGLLYTVAFLWFFEGGLPGLWSDVLFRTRLGRELLRSGAREPLFNGCVRHFIPIEGDAEVVAWSERPSLSRLAACTHTLTFVGGTHADPALRVVAAPLVLIAEECSPGCGCSPQQTRRVATLLRDCTVLSVLVLLFMWAMVVWVTFALEARVWHVWGVARVWAGEVAEADVVPWRWYSLSRWVGGGGTPAHFFLQCWRDSRTNTTSRASRAARDAPRPPPSPLPARRHDRGDMIVSSLTQSPSYDGDGGGEGAVALAAPLTGGGEVTLATADGAGGGDAGAAALSAAADAGEWAVGDPSSLPDVRVVAMVGTLRACSVRLGDWVFGPRDGGALERRLKGETVPTDARLREGAAGEFRVAQLADELRTAEVAAARRRAELSALRPGAGWGWAPPSTQQEQHPPPLPPPPDALAALLGGLECGAPSVEEDAKGAVVVFPVSRRLPGPLADFVRRQLNPRLKRLAPFSGKCVRVTLLSRDDASSLHAGFPY
eukprot:gene11225-53450_t